MFVLNYSVRIYELKSSFSTAKENADRLEYNRCSYVEFILSFLCFCYCPMDNKCFVNWL